MTVFDCQPAFNIGAPRSSEKMWGDRAHMSALEQFHKLRLHHDCIISFKKCLSGAKAERKENLRENRTVFTVLSSPLTSFSVSAFSSTSSPPPHTPHSLLTEVKQLRRQLPETDTIASNSDSVTY